MELNWSTIVLEIINFLVLIWLLKRFLYQPVFHIIEARREAIEQTLSEAKAREQAAEQLRDEFENRLADWQRDKEAARDQLTQELQQRRSAALAELEASLKVERERAAVVAGREEKERRTQSEREALALAGRFAERLLEGVSGPELETRLIELFCSELAELDDRRRAELQRAAPAAQETVEVATAYPLDEATRRQLQEAINDVLGRQLTLSFTEQPELIAGVRLSVGGWTAGANLHDELAFFTEPSHAID